MKLAYLSNSTGSSEAMTITLHPVKIEAYDEVNDLVFTLEMHEETCATAEIKTVLSLGNVDDVFAAVKEGLAMMKLTGDEGKS